MRFQLLLTALLGLFMVLPYEVEHIKSMLALFGGIIIPLSAGTLGVTGRVLPGIACAIVLMSLHELANLRLMPAWISMAILTVYFWAAASLVLRQVFQQRLRTSELMCGALSCYLLLGLGWTAAFGLLDDLHPDALKSEHKLDSTGLVYYTFMTMLTIGYGDITPETPLARMMAVLTGLSGMVFTTVVLASLVSLRTNNPRQGVDP